MAQMTYSAAWSIEDRSAFHAHLQSLVPLSDLVTVGDTLHTEQLVQEDLDAAVAGFDPEIAGLADLQQQRIRAIDQQTEAMITSGMVLKGQLFGTAPHDQQNWSLFISSLLRSPGETKYMLPADSDTPVGFADADADTIEQTLTSRIMLPRLSGRALKAAVLAATTRTELATIVDDRTAEAFELGIQT